MARSKRLLPASIAAVALAIGVAAYFATRPSAALSAIQRAVAAKNYLALNQLVDFPALRASVKAGLVRDLEARLGQPSSTGARLGAMLGNMLIGPVVDLTVSPIGLAFVLEGYSLKDAVSATQSASEAEARPVANMSYATRWESLSEYAIDIRSNGAPVSTLRLRRYGLFEWKLASAELALGE